MKPLTLALRTPSGLIVDTPVSHVQAEDLDGWFGISQGRSDLVAVLPPGLLVFRDATGEGFIALEGGVLDLNEGRCHVMSRKAMVSRELESLADDLEQLMSARQARGRARADMLSDLIREALQRLVREERA